jgi:hypothetical protein
MSGIRARQSNRDGRDEQHRHLNLAPYDAVRIGNWFALVCCVAQSIFVLVWPRYRDKRGVTSLYLLCRPDTSLPF